METAQEITAAFERRLVQIERKMADLEDHLNAVARHTAELDHLRHEVGNLKIEVEQMSGE